MLLVGQAAARECLPSRSQWGEEQIIIDRFFPGVRGGIYVEIGAYDGLRFSNTLRLDTCLDWTGTLVEGNRKIFQLLRENAARTRRRASLWHGAVCAPPKNFTMFASRGTAVAGDQSQMDAVFSKTWAGMHNSDRNNPRAFVRVPCFPMSYFLAAVPHVHFFSLDVETAELEVVSTLDFTVTSVDLFMVEWPRTLSERAWKIRRALVNVGYVECPDVVNASAVFLHSRRADLISECCRSMASGVGRRLCADDAARAQAALRKLITGTPPETAGPSLALVSSGVLLNSPYAPSPTASIAATVIAFSAAAFWAGSLAARGARGRSGYARQ